MNKLVIALLAAIVMLGAGAKNASAQNVTISAKMFWIQDALDLPTAQGYTYTHYDDVSVTGTVLSGATCAQQVPPVASVFDCQSPFPAFTPGAHTVAITAKNAAGESLKSTPIAFQFVVIPSAPRGLRSVG